MKQKLIAWFSARNARERTLVLLMGFALLWLILWYGVWLPLQNAIDEGKAAINRARDTQTWMLTQA
ncbi:type II secretion system protein GspM, partial [Franconibacter pulveris]